MVREKIVAASSRQLIILIDETKLVAQLGQRHKLPVEVIPFGLALCQRRLQTLGCRPVLDLVNGRPFVSDNGNYILDCAVDLIPNPNELDCAISRIPGVVGTGLFLGMAETVLVGRQPDFTLIEERRRRVV
jgi:ribose 5-phosphate isomerase A